jgi:anthranilate synthase component 1
LRDSYPRVFLFESSDYHGAGDCRSFICCDPIAECVIDNGECSLRYLNESHPPFLVAPERGLKESLGTFLRGIDLNPAKDQLPKGVSPGVFGYIAYNAIPYVEQITFSKKSPEEAKIPEVHLSLFRYVIAFNPLRGEAYVLENTVEGEHREASAFESFMRRAFQGEIRTFPFEALSEERSVVSDQEFLNMIATCKRHIARGDVFQIVPSRRYSRGFIGDDFQVYRALRAINPSPYLFYCDFGGYRLLGSSPEAQINITDGKVGIYPIAGTYPRSGNDDLDGQRARKLLDDPKENAEHCMLVDLARNDLSRHCENVRVAAYRETQYYSHLIHLVSKVEGTLPDRSLNAALEVLCDTFPIGTLSGAPKHSAMRILDTIEPHGRGHYGGCVGFIGFNGDIVMGIVIRSLLSINQTLIYQAGMVIVSDSDPNSEIAEAHTKLGAIRAAIERAGGITD